MSATAEAIPRLYALNVVDHPQAGSQIGVVAKRTYCVRNGTCLVADEQLALVEEPLLSDDASMLIHDIDTVLNRTQVDVIVSGHAYPPHVARSFDARVSVGTLERRLRVFGDRTCARERSGRLRFSEPTELGPVDLSWTSAYGGADRVSAQKFGDPIQQFCQETKQPYEPVFGSYAYPRNRAGKGYLVDASDEALAACALPNLEDPEQLLTPESLVIGQPGFWPSGPRVAALGWLSYNYFPRSAMLGLFTYFDQERFAADSFYEVRAGVLQPQTIAASMPLAKRMEIAVAQQAAPGMRVAELAANAAVELQHLHRAHALWQFTLAGEVPSMLLQLPDGPPIDLSPQIRTVYIEPDHDRVSLVWVGEHREATPVGPGKLGKIKCAAKWP